MAGALSGTARQSENMAEALSGTARWAFDAGYTCDLELMGWIPPN